MFSLEGRRAPGLYLVGWLATALGAAFFVPALLFGAGGLGALLLGSLLLGPGLLAGAGAQAIERRDRTDLAYRGPSPFLLLAASLPLSILVTLPIVVAGLPVTSPLATLLSVAATGAIWLILVAMTVVGPGALTWREIALGLRGAPVGRIVGDVLVGAAAAVPVMLATGVLASILIFLVGVAPEGPIAPPRDGPSLALSLLAAALLAPIGEELFYRGFATTAWLRSYGPTRAIVQGGLFFAFVHILTLGGPDFDHAARAALVAFVVRIPVALALGWIFVRRRSLAASFGLHATFNGALVVLSALATAAPA
ncbi:MAG: CPBP family intramembrane metalloprotease [Chloroflexota bacterium]|nr:CPBP family intramembrane metalloprotease [Chloroflexota bacterium]